MAVQDVSAPRKKYALKKFAEAWNKKNPGHLIVRPDGVNPDVTLIGDPARVWVARMQAACHLPVTHKFDRATMQKLLPPGIRGQVMAIAHAELGEHEWPPGSNMGEIVEYLHVVGLSGGYPWCAAFVTWCLRKSGFTHLPPNPAYVPSWDDWAQSRGLLKPVSESRLGDLWIWWKNQHIGFCDDTNPEDWIAYGLDGNVGSYGGSVTQVRRTSQEVTACVDLLKLRELK